MFKAHRLLYHATLGSGVIKKKIICSALPLPSEEGTTVFRTFT